MAKPILPEDLPSNNIKDRQKPDKTSTNDRKKIEPVVTGEVKQRKKSLGRRMAESFTGDDAKGVGEYLIFDVLIPSAKSMLAEAASQGAERLLFGEVRRARPSTSPYRPSYTSYSRPRPGGVPADRRGFSAPRPEPANASRVGGSYNDILLETRGEAEAVIDGLITVLEEYDVATVNDLYDLVGITGNFTDEKFGWFDLRSAGVVRDRNGYILNLPKPTPID